MTRIVHKVIAETAKKMAAAQYDALAMNNDFYAKWPTRRLFVRRCWEVFIPDARNALLTILADTSGRYHDHLKQPIYEALLIDGEYKAPPQHVPPGAMMH